MGISKDLCSLKKTTLSDDLESDFSDLLLASQTSNKSTFVIECFDSNKAEKLVRILQDYIELDAVTKTSAQVPFPDSEAHFSVTIPVDRSKLVKDISERSLSMRRVKENAETKIGKAIKGATFSKLAERPLQELRRLVPVDKLTLLTAEDFEEKETIVKFLYFLTEAQWLEYHEDIEKDVWEGYKLNYVWDEETLSFVEK